MVIKSKLFKNLYVPSFKLAGKDIGFTKEITYLGYMISENMDDTSSIVKETRNIYVRGNTLIRNFRHCTDEVKVELFRTYCSNVYCCALRSRFRSSQMEVITVALNKTFKYLMRKQRDYSASMLFVSHNVNCLKVIIRKMVYSLLSRIERSSNLLVSTIVNSKYYRNSSLYTTWKSILYINSTQSTFHMMLWKNEFHHQRILYVLVYVFILFFCCYICDVSMDYV